MEKQLLNIEEFKILISEADKTLSEMKFTEHNLAHVSRVSKFMVYILETLGYDEHTCKLAKLAGYLHDIGNVVNRQGHAQSGAIMLFNIFSTNKELLEEFNLTFEDVLKIISAIGNHDEVHGSPVSPIAAALIISDKADIRRSRVRKTDLNTFDIHDRVNYSVYSSSINIDKEKEEIQLKLKLDTEYSSIMEYFTIFSDRMQFCKKAAEYFGYKFCLYINEVILSN